MKRLSFLFTIGSLAVVSLLSSCKKTTTTDPKPAASMTAFIGSSGVISKISPAGEMVTITYEANSGESLSKLELNRRKAGGTSTVVAGFPKNPTGTNEKGTVTVESDGTEVFYDFKVTDSKGSVATKTITLNPAGAGMTYATWTAKLVGAQSNSAGSYFSSSTGMVYLSTQAGEKANVIDITFAQTGSPSTTPKLISPDFRGDASMGLIAFAGGTATMFKASSLNFVTATDAQLNAISGSAKSVTVAQGGTYEFVNSMGKKGLINVTNFTPGTGVNGSITIDVKVQK